MRKTMMNDEQGDHQQNQEGRPVMRATILRYGAAALLLLGVSVFLAGPAQAAINDHRSPDGTCNGVPEPPNPAGTPCDRKICTNDGDWMCCKLCTASGGYCCEQIATSSSKGSGMRVPGGRLQKAPEMTTTAPSTMIPRTDMKTAPIRQRGVESEQPSESAPDKTTPPNQTVPDQSRGK